MTCLPTFTNVGDVGETKGSMAVMLASRYTVELMEWQRLVLDAMLAVDARGKWAHPAFGLSVPRQNGKSELVRARCLWGIVSRGEQILYTCQHGDTSDMMFKMLADPFEDDRNPELQSMLKAVRKANGQQAIIMKNGGGVRFTTRTNSLTRGRTYDVLVYDEAQELTDGEQAASMPAISAGRLHNPQTIYLGTPPEPSFTGGVFKRQRDYAVKGDSRAPAWMEWGVDEIGDITDRGRWARTNPALGELIDESAVEGELTMAPAMFARERLGWWSEDGGVIPVIDQSLWNLCATDEPSEEGAASCGVKFSHDGARTCVCMCRRGDPDYIELVFDEPASRGTAWLAEWLCARKDRICSVVIDGGAAGDLVQKLQTKRFPRRAATIATAKTVRDSSAMMLAAVNEHGVEHWRDAGQQALDESVATSERRAIGDGFGFDGPNAAPIEAASLALWAARTNKRDPEKRLRIG